MGAYFAATFKKYFTSKTFYFSLFFSFFFLISMGSILPSGMIVPSAITFSTLIIVVIMFGGSLLETRKTSFIKSLSLTKISKIKYFFVHIIVVTCFVFISTGVILFCAWILVDINFLEDSLEAFGRPALVAGIDWQQVDWASLLYAIIMTSAVTFSLTFLVVSFTKSSYNLYLFVFVYSFFLFAIGDLIIPKFVYDGVDYKFITRFYWILPHYYTNKLIAGSIATTNLLPDIVANNQDAILSDVNALEAWANVGFPVTHLGMIDWSSVPGYENYTFEIDRLNDNIVQFALVQYARTHEETFITYIFTVDSVLTFGDEYNLWVFGSLDSMMICFFPIVLFATFSTVSIKTFKWTSR